MVSMTTTMTLSAFVQAPTKGIDALEDGDVVLTRRAGASLRLSKAVDAEQELSVIQQLTQLIAASLDDDTAARIAEHLAEPLPWIAFLPEPSRVKFVGEYLRLARASVAVGRFDRLSTTLASWEATAQAYADPNLRPDGADLDYLDEPETVPSPFDAG